MRWISWRSIRADTSAPASEPVAEPRCGRSVTTWRAELERRGVPTDFSRTLAERAHAYAATHGPEAASALLDGMAIAFEVEHATRDQLARSLRGLREVERMMGAFSGELSKLDEVLGVLAAYVRRMRSSGGAESDRTLH